MPDRDPHPLAAVLALAALAGGCSGGTSGVPESERLHALFAEEWELRLQEDPLLATAVGDHRFDDRLPAVGTAEEARRAAASRDFLDRLRTIDREALGELDRVHAEVFEHQLQGFLDSFAVAAYRLPLTSDEGFHITFARLPEEMPVATTADLERYTARLRAFPDWVEQHIALLEEGLERGVTLPQVVLAGYDVTIASHVVEDVEDSVFFAPFGARPTGVPAADWPRLEAAGRAAIAEAVVPGYRRFLDFMSERYRPGARKTLGASQMTAGEAYYAQRIRHFTTLDLTAEAIHQTGLMEVERIQEEMAAILETVGFDGDLPAFIQHLRSDPRFYAETPEALLREAAFIAKRMDGHLPALFHLDSLPRRPYGVAPVPDHLAPRYTAGRYVGAPVGSSQPGTYWVNTYALDSRPLYTLTALTLHEAVPGHHLQIGLSQEMEDLPPFRRFTYLSAFGEGWGLYAERLGREVGMYEDPYSDFGRLTYEMWRACRLVVDTGLHAMGWSRRQAVDYMAERTALSLHEVGTEIDRYISWPGQALAYKLGELKIRELRGRAEAALGPAFDLRDFHRVVLAGGAVPLPVLEARVDRYLASSRPAG